MPDFNCISNDLNNNELERVSNYKMTLDDTYLSKFVRTRLSLDKISNESN